VCPRRGIAAPVRNVQLTRSSSRCRLLATGSYVLVSASYHARAEGYDVWHRHFELHKHAGLMTPPKIGWVLLSDQDKVWFRVYWQAVLSRTTV
jgi:hypothetical protein